MANQYAQLFQIVGKLQDQVNLSQKIGEPLVGPLNITGDIIATGDITGDNLIADSDVFGSTVSSGSTITAVSNISTTNGDFVGGASGSLILNGIQVVGLQQPDIINLTDNSGGTANNIIASITDVTTPGSADIGPVRDAIADLAAKVNAILTALKNHGLIANGA